MHLFFKDNVDLDKTSQTHKLLSVFAARIFNEGIFHLSRVFFFCFFFLLLFFFLFFVFFVNLGNDKESVKREIAFLCETGK